MSVERTLRAAGQPAGDIQVIARCAQLLRLFSTSQRSLRVSDVGAEIGLQRTTVHRYLSSMANAGFLERDSEGFYSLGPLLVQLGTVALRGLRVLEIGGPCLQQLADEADETAVIAVWGGLGPVAVRCRSRRPSRRCSSPSCPTVPPRSGCWHSCPACTGGRSRIA